MKSTFSRTLTAVAVLFLAALAFIGLGFQILAKNYITTRAIDALKADAKVISDLVQAVAEDNRLSGQDFALALTVATSVSEADTVICSDSGELVVCASHPLGCEHLGLYLDRDFLERTFREDGCESQGTIPGLYDDARYVVSAPIVNSNGQRLGVVIVSSPMEETLAVMNRISRIFLTVSVLTTVIVALVMVIFARRHAEPLREMARTATAFGHGELDARVPTKGNFSEEVEELALAFNNMASSLQKSEYQRQEFVANVSHELKTPMTTISGYVDGILDGTIPPEKQRQYLQIVSDETKRLNRLVRSMLDISRLQDAGGVPEDQKSRFDVEECVGQVLVTFEQKIVAKGLDVQVDMPAHPVYTKANCDAITQVIYNLTDNAVKFCPEGGNLAVTVRIGGNRVFVSVANDGETIPPEELPLVFDRFHKTDKSRSRERDSWGLGLYIAKTIIDAHAENISVTSRDGRTVFTFTLPLVN